jgi:hypothetical protein
MSPLAERPQKFDSSGCHERFRSVNPSKFSEKEAFDETYSKPMSFGLGSLISIVFPLAEFDSFGENHFTHP